MTTWGRCWIAGAVLLAGCAKEAGGKPFNAPANTSASSSSSNDYAFVGSAQDASGSRVDEIGTATWYGNRFAGKKTSSGERFDPRAMTAAHRKLPFGTWVEVRRIDNGATVRVRITDRGPHGDARKIIDLSQAAAERLGMIQDGSARIELRVVRGPE